MSVPRVVSIKSMLDNSFCCWRSLNFGAKIRNDFPKVPWMLKAYQVQWFDSGAATCTLMCMRVVVYYL